MTKGFKQYDDYEFTLGNELEQLAKDELRETKETRDHAIKLLREWIESNPRIFRARTDASFLLRFLRARKFSVPMAQDCIERYLLLRNFTRDNIGLFRALDMEIPNIAKLFALGYAFALPERDALGRRVVFYRPGVFDPSVYSNVEMLKMHGIIYETLLEDEENQIKGIVHLCDASGIAIRYLTLFTPKEAVRISKNAERFLPMRHKAIIAFNIHASLKFAVDFGLGLISEKLRSRIFMNTSIETTAQVDRRILPKEYGGTMPMQEMIDRFKKELQAHRDIVLQNDDMCVNLEMYSEAAREGAVSAMRKPLGCNPSDEKNTYGMQGSFRKLEVD